MKDVRDLTSVIDTLGDLKAVLFVNGETYLCSVVSKALQNIHSYEYYSDLCPEVAYSAMVGIRYVNEALLDSIRAASDGEVHPDDEYKDRCAYRRMIRMFATFI